MRDELRVYTYASIPFNQCVIVIYHYPGGNIFIAALSCNDSFISGFNNTPYMFAVVSGPPINGCTLTISCATGHYLDPPGTGENKTHTCIEKSDPVLFTRAQTWSPFINEISSFSCPG